MSDGSPADGADAGGGRARNRSPHRLLLVAAAAVVVVAAGGMAWARWHRPMGDFCTLTGAIDTPVAASPAAAFDAWWDQGGPRTLVSNASVGPPPDGAGVPTRADLERVAEGEWRWYYRDDRDRWVQVDVDEVGAALAAHTGPGWAVSGVNQCNRSPLGGW